MIEGTEEEWTVEKAITSLQALVANDPNNAKLKIVFLHPSQSQHARGHVKYDCCFITGFEHAEGYDRIELVGDYE